MEQSFVHVRTAAEKRSYRKRVLRRNIIGTLMACPPFIGFLAFTLTPMIISLYLSFTELHSYNLMLAKPIGIDNYVNIFKQELLWTSVVNTESGVAAVFGKYHRQTSERKPDRAYYSLYSAGMFRGGCHADVAMDFRGQLRCHQYYAERDQSSEAPFYVG